MTPIVILCIFLASHAHGHGRLVDPPARSTMWRLGFDTPVHYNDHQLFCGGYSRQWGKNHGRCGECGDPWDLPRPRPHEAGGTWGTGVISKVYRQGQIITVTVHLTANHMGWFEFRLCPNNNPKQYVKQRCLNKHVLRLVDYPGTRYELKHSQTGLFMIRLQLPKNVVCSQCVVQWHYTTGNNWGFCKDGSNQPGCGPQEVFRGCSDIAIFAPEDPTFYQFLNLTRESDFSQFLHLNETPEADRDEYDQNIDTDVPQTNEINVAEIDTVERTKIKDTKINSISHSLRIDPQTQISKPSITFIDDEKPESRDNTAKENVSFKQDTQRKKQNQALAKKYVSSDDFRKGQSKDLLISAPTPFIPLNADHFKGNRPMNTDLPLNPSPLGPPLVFSLPEVDRFPVTRDEIRSSPPAQTRDEYRLVNGKSRSLETTFLIPVQDDPPHVAGIPLSALQMLAGITDGELHGSGTPASGVQVPVSNLQDGDAMQRLMILKQVLDLASSSASVHEDSPVFLIIA
ncbi:uncharacterized protein [Palaemon carinicauda]|uniref:uncharacterized protein n=1 Tax=Palaemon carinicauda TaxID=392227 RepID=UPI0035B5D3AA